MIRRKLILTVGLPRSGKSTWAQTQDVPIVNPDSIRLAIHGAPYIQLAEPFVWAVAQTMVRSLFIAGHSEVILDATNTTHARRAMWESCDWVRVYREFSTSSPVCIERATENRPDLIPVIERMAEKWEPIDKSDYDLESYAEVQE